MKWFVLCLVLAGCGTVPDGVDSGFDGGSDAGDEEILINGVPWEEYAAEHVKCVRACEVAFEWFALCGKGHDLLVDNVPGCVACLVEGHNCGSDECESTLLDLELKVEHEDCAQPWGLWRCHPLYPRETCDGWEEL